MFLMVVSQFAIDQTGYHINKQLQSGLEKAGKSLALLFRM